MEPWKKKEVRSQKKFNAHPTPRSGGLWFAKGDGQSDELLIEDKTTKHSEFRVTAKLWKKVEKDSLVNQRIPILSVGFLTTGLVLIVFNKFDFDLNEENFLIKTIDVTENSFSLKNEEWTAWMVEAFTPQNKKLIPVFLFNFLNINRQLLVIDEDDLVSLIEGKKL